MLIKLDVTVPASMDAASEEWLRRLAELRNESPIPANAPGRTGFLTRMREAFNGL
jgi:DnaJ-class molecular chaperone